MFPCVKKSSKYFLDYKHNEGVTPLCVLLPKISGYLKHLKNFDDAKTFSFLFEDEKVLEKYNEIWSKFKEITKREKLNSDPVFMLTNI